MADTLEKEVIKEICATGDKTNTIPDTTGVGSNALSYADGFPVATSTPQSDGGIPPKRTDMNKVLNMLSKNQEFLQNGGSFSFDSSVSTVVGGYPKGARLLYNDKKGNKYYVESLKNNNTDEPSAENILKISKGYYYTMPVVATSNDLPADDTNGSFCLCLGDNLVYVWNISLQRWDGYSLLRDCIISNLDSSAIYIFDETDWVNANTEYSWITYNTETEKPIVGINSTAIKNLITGTKDIPHLANFPTLVIYGDVEDQTDSNWNFKLQVSTDQTNWITISSWKVGSGDPDSSPIYNTIIDAGLYWKFTCSKNTYTLKYASLI